MYSLMTSALARKAAFRCSVATCQFKAPLSGKGPLLAAESSFSLEPYSKRSLSKGLFVGVETSDSVGLHK